MQFGEYVENQTYQMRMSMIHLTINIILLPLLSIAANSDIFKIAGQLFSFARLNESFVLTDGANFYVTIIMQNASLGILNIVVRLTDLFNNCGSCKKVDTFYYHTRTKPLKHKEIDVYQYGYYYALASTIINATTIYG